MIHSKIPGKFYRTCQECGNEQTAIPPNQDKELTDSYCNAKCRKCGSEALDYGSQFSNVPFDLEDET